MSRQESQITEREVALITERSAQTSTWLYWAVFDYSGFRRWTASTAAILSIGLYFLVAWVNPSLPGGSGRNTIDRLTDPRLFSDYTRAGFTALARSGRWIAAGTTSRGLVLLPVKGKTPHEHVIAGSVLDVTASGRKDESFLALTGDQEIVDVGVGGIRVLRSTWLIKPEWPRWQTSGNVSGDNVVASLLDSNGLLVAIKGAGVARYRLDPGTGNRLRSWLAPKPLGDTSVVAAVLTPKGLWVGSTDGVRFGDLATLQEDPERTAKFEGLVRLDAGQDGLWASAIDSSGAARTFDGRAWKGPWFGLQGQPREMSTRSEVLVARQDEKGDLWLGTRDGLLSYEVATHRMRSLGDNSRVEYLEFVAGGTISAGTGGVALYPNTSSVTPAKKLSGAPASQLQVSADRNLIVFRSVDSRGSESYMALPAPFTNVPMPISPSDGWKTSPALRVAGVTARAQIGTLVGTSAGCILYRPDLPSYADCSKLSTGGDVRSFTTLEEEEDGSILASGDGLPLVWQGQAWRSLSAGMNAAVTQLASVGGRIIGLTADRTLRDFPNDERGMKQHILGAFTEFATQSEQRIGDLYGTAEAWRLAFARGRRLAVYDSTDARYVEQSIPDDVRQVRLLKDGALVLTDSGTVVNPVDGREVFGRKGGPFDPTQTTAIGQGSGSTALIGDAMGQVARYAWNSANWTGLGRVPGGPVLELVQGDSSLWARTATGVFSSSNLQWSMRPGISKLAVDGQNRVWLAGATGVRLEANPAVDYSNGGDVRRFLSEGRFLWQPTADRVFVFTGGSQVGIFDSRTDRWTISNTALNTPDLFLPGGNFLVVRDGRRLLRMNAALEIADLLGRTAPAGMSVFRSGDTLRAMYNDNGTAVLSVWSDIREALSQLYTWTAESGPIDDVEVAADGKLWTLRGGVAVELEMSGTTLRQTQRSVALPSLRSFAGAPQTFDQQRTPAASADLSYGGTRLEFSWTGSSGMKVAWRGRSDLSVWCDDNGRLAVQCVREVAVEGDVLVLATDFGVLRRSVLDYSLLGAAPGRRRIDRPASSVRDAGGWVWGIERGALVVRQGTRIRLWTSGPDGERFRDDVVVHIGIKRSTDAITLQSLEGSWSFNLVEGRTGPDSAGDSEDLIVDNAAIRVTYRQGRISFRAFDGGEAIVDGRMFFDQLTAVRAFRGELYAVVAGRALVRRDGASFGRITGAWRLPLFGGLRLDRGERGVIVASSNGGYELVGNSWERVTATTTSAMTGAFQWRFGAGNGFTPWVRDTRGVWVEVPRWWDGDRFTWDRVIGAGALSRDLVVVITPLGPLTRHLSNGGSASANLWLLPDIRTLAPARRNSDLIGVLIGGRYLMRQNSQGQSTLDRAPAGLARRAQLVLDWRSDRGRYIGFHEEWAESDRPAIESRIPTLPTRSLFQQGRFAFDLPRSVGRGRGDRWIVVSESNDGRQVSAVLEDTGQALLLRAVDTLEEPIEHVRGASDGRLFGRLKSAGFVEFAAQSRPVRASSAGDAFFNGQAVHLSLQSLTWSAKQRTIRDTGSALTWEPKEYPLFTSGAGGTALSFDVLQTLAVDTATNSVALGTAGGVLHCLDSGGRPLSLSPDRCRLDFDFGKTKSPKDWLLDVSRLRAGQDGRLWARYAGGKIASRTSDGSWQSEQGQWPGQELRAGQHLISVTRDGVSINGLLYRESNDAWPSEVRALEGIVDIVGDPEGQVAWLASRKFGVFKVRLSYLHRLRSDHR